VYFDHWAGAFHVILAHVGGNDDAQSLLFHLPSVFNIDENRWEISLYNTGTPLFWRSSDRIAPHNMYVSTYMLRSYAARHGQNWSYGQAYLMHKIPAPPSQRGRSATIDISFLDPLGPQSNPAYAVHYEFQPTSDTYLRILGGVPHIDSLTGRALQPSNVVIMETDPGQADPLAGPTPLSILIRNLGTGRAVFFMDGKVTYGSWSQRDQFAPLRFYNSKGRQESFNPGQTWIELVPQGSPVSWTSR
jgi:hypothetical protein